MAIRARLAVAAVVCAGAALLPGAAAAQPYPPITTRDYAIDLYRGSAVGPPNVIAMGGATVALIDGAPGMLGNPAAVAVRPRSARETWDWDGHLDATVPSVTEDDFDNNGATSSLTARAGSLGLLGLYGPWGLGVSATLLTYELRPDAMSAVEVTAAVARVALGRALLDEALVVGAGLRFGTFSVAPVGNEDSWFSAVAAALELGAVLSPRGGSSRYGARVSLPSRGTDVKIDTEACDPLDCAGRVLPERAEIPWEIAVGIAHRFAPAAWNATPTTRFADERALTVGADLLLSGPVDGATGLEPFADGFLQPSGESVVVSWRAGAEYEWFPGRFRARAGTYWEPARFAGTRGRLHVTLGAELRVWSFQFWGAERRLALSFAADGAEQYSAGGLSLGFWH